MTIGPSEAYFKPKINWKLFNLMLDACTELEDKEQWFNIEISILNNSNTNDSNSYNEIFCYYSNKGESEYYEYGQTAVNIEKRFEQYGLFYILTTSEEAENIAKKIENSKHIKRLPNRNTPKIKKYTFVVI